MKRLLVYLVILGVVALTGVGLDSALSVIAEDEERGRRIGDVAKTIAPTRADHRGSRMTIL